MIDQVELMRIVEHHRQDAVVVPAMRANVGWAEVSNDVTRDVPASGAMGMFTYRTYISKYGRHETNDVRPHAARLGCPLLVTAGEIEAAYFRELAQELYESAGADVCTRVIVDGANHFYDGCEGFMIDTLDGWLREKVS